MKKIALDFDGTIADTNRPKAALIKKLYDIDLEPWQCDHTLCLPTLGIERCQEVGKVVYEEESTLETPPLPDVLELLPKLAEQAELYMVTARDTRRMAFTQTWLKQHGLYDHFHGFWTNATPQPPERFKLDVCRENGLELLMDDDIRHLPTGWDEIAKVLIKPGLEEKIDVPDDVALVTGWKGFYQFCVDSFLNK